MTTWEYKVMTVAHLPCDDDPFTAALNREGKDGWELVTATTRYVESMNVEFHKCVFKRAVEGTT